MSGSSELTLEQCLSSVAAYADQGGRALKISGGDPALYSALPRLVERIRQTTTIETIEVLSRHPRFAALVNDVVLAGATHLNVSVDTLARDVHHRITGVDDLSQVLGMVDACLATGLPLKINSVILGGINDGEVEDLAAWASDMGVTELKLLDLIRDMDASRNANAHPRGIRLANHFVSLSSLLVPLASRAVDRYSRTQGGFGHPMTTLVTASGLKITLKDHTKGAWYAEFCRSCHHFPCHDALMAVRVTPDFRLQPCLLRENLASPLAERDGSLARVGIRMGRLFGHFRRASFHECN